MIARRLLRLVATLWVVTFLSFLLVSLLPGDPALEIVGPQYATEERVAEVREELGFDDPIPVRYADWISDVVRGDLGESYRSRQTVLSAVSERASVSIELILAAQALAVGGALIVAPLAAYRPGGWLDRALRVTNATFFAIPAFTLGLLLIFVFAVRLHVFPATGFVQITRSFPDHVRSMVLPSVTLAAVPFAIYTQALRTELVGVLDQDYILLARSKGLSPLRLLMRHALRPSTLPVITLIGINMGTLIGGAVIVEVVYSLPGLGRLLVDAINGRDYLMVQGIVALITIVYVVVNALVDTTYALIDPRLRLQRAAG